MNTFSTKLFGSIEKLIIKQNNHYVTWQRDQRSTDAPTLLQFNQGKKLPYYNYW